MWGDVRHRALRWGGLVTLTCGLGLTVATSASAAALRTQLLAQAGYGPAPIGFARTSDGVLHVVFATNTNWGNSASGVSAITISPAGKPGSLVQALTWTGLSNGSPSGVPGLAVLPSGALQATFGGSPGNVPGPWAITSTDGGNTWSPPANVGSGVLADGDSAVGIAVSNGTPVLVAGCCGGIVIQQGEGVGAPTALLTNSNDNAATNTQVALDAATGAVVVGWPSNAGSGGLWFQQAAPTTGPAQKLPIPSQYGTGEPLPIAGRDSGPGVFAAYPADYGTTTHIRLARYGGGSVAVGSVNKLHATDWGVATSLSGRMWVIWYGQINGKGIMAFTRSNRAVTRFEPIQRYSYNWSSLFTLNGDGRLGPLDLLASGTPALKNGQAPTGIYHARVLPEMSGRASAHAFGKPKQLKYQLSVVITDAGDAVSGAKVAIKGQSAQTNAKGMVSFTLNGTAGKQVAIRVTHAGYRALRIAATL